MYRPSKYYISQASLEFFAKRFNESPNHRNLEWRYINEESFVNDGYFIDVGTGKSLGYDWEIRDNYFENGRFKFPTIRQFDRKMQKDSIKLSIQGDRDCMAFIAVWHDDLRKGKRLEQPSKTDYGHQDAIVWETNQFRIYQLKDIAKFKDMIDYALNKGIYDYHAFDLETSKAR